MILTHGTHQEMHFDSKIPAVDIHLGDQTCRAPCSLRVRRQWASYTLEASQNGRVVAEGPVYRRERYLRCEDEKGWNLMLSDVPDIILLVPFVVNLSMGITGYHPETVVVEEGAYRLEDPCFPAPIEGGPRPVVRRN
jgi:hypothetical protein